MKFKEYAMKYLPKINQEIQLIFDKKLEKINNSFLKDYYSELKDYFLSGGKRIRPLMCIAAYNAFSGEKEDQILKACVGTEFLHNASLVHDDIIDKDDFRRGKPSFVSLLGHQFFFINLCCFSVFLQDFFFVCFPPIFFRFFIHSNKF